MEYSHYLSLPLMQWWADPVLAMGSKDPNYETQWTDREEWHPSCSLWDREQGLEREKNLLPLYVSDPIQKDIGCWEDSELLGSSHQTGDQLDGMLKHKAY